MSREKAKQIADALLGERDADDHRSAAAYDQFVDRLLSDAEFAAAMEQQAHASVTQQS